MGPDATRIILHAGMHKTGTTAIQEYLHTQPRILARNDVYYPSAGRRSTTGKVNNSHYELAWSTVARYAKSKNRMVHPDFWRQVRADIEANPCSVAILSSEFFWPATCNEITAIRAYLADYNVRVVLYMRNILEVMVSSYAQQVKTGNQSRRFSDFLQKRLWRHDYAAIIDRWVSVFGRENVEVRSYNKVRKHLIEDFVDAVGVVLPTKHANKRSVNVSPSDGAIRIIRWLNSTEQVLRAKGIPAPVISSLRRNITRNQVPGVVAARIADIIMPQPILKEEHIIWLREATQDMQARFLEKYVAPEDHHYFDF